MHIRLVPENHVFQLIGASRVINHETFVVLGTLTHDLAEEVKTREGRSEVVKDTFAIVDEILAQDEDKVHVCTKNWRNTERVLHSNNEKDLLMTTVQEEVANILIVNPRVIVETVIHN